MSDMGLSFRESCQLRALERGLRRSEPELAEVLDAFGRADSEDAVVSREQPSRPDNWPGLVLVRARHQLSRVARALFLTPSEAVNFTQAMRSPE
jgi:hypothetical protein